MRWERWITIFLGVNALTAATVAVAAPAVPRTPPPANMRTLMMVEPIPQGWIGSVYKTNGVAEYAELTPVGQTNGLYTDLIGFTVIPLPPGKLITVDQMQKMESNAADSVCRVSASRDSAPTAAQAGWGYTELYCIDRTGGKPGSVELVFKAMTAKDGYVLQVWRTWRGPADAFNALVKTRTGIDAKAAIKASDGADFDTATINRINQSLIDSYTADLVHIELCDFALGERCPSFTPLPPVPGSVAMLQIAGSHEVTGDAAVALADKIYPGLAAKFKTDGKPFKGVQAVQSISLADHDWTITPGLAAALQRPLIGAKMDGGVLSAIDQGHADLPTRARMQAYIVYASRAAWLTGIAPDRETLAFPAP